MERVGSGKKGLWSKKRTISKTFFHEEGATLVLWVDFQARKNISQGAFLYNRGKSDSAVRVSKVRKRRHWKARRAEKKWPTGRPLEKDSSQKGGSGLRVAHARSATNTIFGGASRGG